MANLTASGIDPKAINTVISSHFHSDHINGLRGKDGTLTYPTPRSWCRCRSGRSGWTTRTWTMAAQEKMLVAGYHYPFPAMGHIVILCRLL
jgi:ribonuclease BN (tRNA processing enzyme)